MREVLRARHPDWRDTSRKGENAASVRCEHRQCPEGADRLLPACSRSVGKPRTDGVRPCTIHAAPVCRRPRTCPLVAARSEEHTSELQSLMRTSYAVFCLKKK